MKAKKGKPPVAPTTEGLGINTQRKKDIYMSNIVTKAANIVEFHGDSLETLLINDEPYVALKPICEGIGLDWRGQINRIKRDEVLNSVVVVTATTGADSKHYQMWTLPLKMLNGWLFGISANRVKPGLKAKLTEYRRECFDVLADYWQKGYAINPRPFKQARDDVLTVEEANLLRQTLEGDAEMLYPDNPEKRGTFIRQGWSKLKSHFGVSYKQIPRFELTAAVSILARHGTEWGMKHESPVTVTEVIKRGMDSIRAMVCVDLRSGDRNVRALKDTEFVVDLGDERHVRAFICDLDKSYYPAIAETIFQHYREVDRVYSGRRRANDMPASALPLNG